MRKSGWGLLFWVPWVAFVVLTPLAGVWLASSLAAFLNGPRALALAAGLLLFPVLPVAWELWSLKRRRPGAKPRLSTFGRLVARTLAVNLLFLGLLVGLNPRSSFAALSTRGDWMLDGRSGERVEWMRAGLFGAANGLEWIYVATRDDPYARWAKENRRSPPPPPEPGPAPVPIATGYPIRYAGSQPDTRLPPDAGEADRKLPEVPEPPAVAAAERPVWPQEAKLHPAVLSMPREAEASLAAVARHLASAEADPLQRVKALHDYVADRVEYDAKALASGDFGDQSAEAVFRTRKAVCAGYAQLMNALGKEMGIELAFLPGQARQSTTGQLSPHAWNAARVGDRWLLLDVTWDSGTVEDGVFKKRYRTDYLFTAPEVFVLDHLPEESGWQRLAQPLSMGDFLRQPALNPSFFIEGLSLLSPTRSRVDADGSVVLELKNPRRVAVLGNAQRVGGGPAEKQRCSVDGVELTRVRCELPSGGAYRIELFGGQVLDTQASAAGVTRTYGMLGSIEVNNRG
ncbi:MAG: transglutaminase domain-containing protein [Myxococcaceae bacterium]